MIDFKKLISEYSHCECGKAHECAIKDIVNTARRKESAKF